MLKPVLAAQKLLKFILETRSLSPGVRASFVPFDNNTTGFKTSMELKKHTSVSQSYKHSDSPEKLMTQLLRINLIYKVLLKNCKLFGKFLADVFS